MSLAYTGAWIETLPQVSDIRDIGKSLPTRGRGLSKLFNRVTCYHLQSVAPVKGATSAAKPNLDAEQYRFKSCCRSREGGVD